MSTLKTNTIRDASNNFPVDVKVLRAGVPWAIYGNTYAVGTDAVNDTNIAAGGCADETAAYWMEGAAITKQLDAAWAVGTNAGGLDTGAIANADYYIWRIARSDTGVVDALYSLSSTAPTMPASYDFKRKVGWIKRVGATIVAYHTYETEGGGIEMTWDSPTVDVNLSNTLTTSRRTDAAKVPLTFSVVAKLWAGMGDNTANATAVVYCPDQSDINPALVSDNLTCATTAIEEVQVYVRTSAAGLVASRGSIATVDVYQLTTIGFNWARRN